MKTTYELRSRREALGLTLAEVSARCGVPVPNLSRIERGEQDPRASTLFRILDALALELRPAGRPTTLADVRQETSMARERLGRWGLASPNPESRLDRRETGGEDVSAERRVLDEER